MQIRSHILRLVSMLVFPSNAEEKEISRDEEFQHLFNYISTVSGDDNLYDVLNQITRQMAEHPAIMVPAFDRCV